MNILLFVILIIGIVGFSFYRKTLSRYVLNFKTSIDKTELPIVTLISNGREFNFLVDTGSNKSHLKIGIAGAMDAVKIDTESNAVITTGNGKVQHYGYYDVKFSFGKNHFVVQRFEVMDLEETFSDWGIAVHGILGIDFLMKLGYKIDFTTNTMYV